MDIDFVIEVYILPTAVRQLRYREIPVGTTVEDLKRPPDFVFKGRYKHGYSLPIDYSGSWYIQTYPKQG